MQPLTRSRKSTAVLILAAIVVGSVTITALFFIGYLITLERQLDHITWSLPATVYAEPPRLYAGRAVSEEWLQDYFHRLNYTQTDSSSLKAGQYSTSGNSILFVSRSFAGSSSHPILVTFNDHKILAIQDNVNKQRLGQTLLEPTELATLFGAQWEKRTLIKLKELPKYIVDAVISIEDRRFYQHNGVDLFSVARAVWSNALDKGPLQGASTITQQLAKNLYLSPEKTLRRKINEALLATLMESKYSKKEILEFYLNEVYLGQSGPISVRGIGEASQLYFRKDARLLTVPEAATLAGLIQAPSHYDPYTHPDKTVLRRNTVLAAMKENGALSDADYQQFTQVALNVQTPGKKINRAPYFLTYVKKQLKDQFSSRALENEDYKVISTLDYDAQIAAQQALSDGLSTIEKIRGQRTNKSIQGSLIAIETTTGKIRAFVGGRNFMNSQFDRLTQAHRQPGSSFKPFVYAAALESAFEEQNRFYTPATLVEDEPWSVQIDKAVWQPRNYNGQYNGVVSLRTALAKSMNIPTAKLAYDIGFYRVYGLARRMGFHNVKPYPSIALGAFEVSPYELIRAYTAFANGGKLVDLQSIAEVMNSKGNIVRDHETTNTPVLHEQTAYLITDMLKTVMNSGTGASIQQWGIHQTMAGKTGTTNDFKDAWFVGYTPDIICLVWVGYDDNTPVGMTGAQAALPIYARFMQKIQSSLSQRDFHMPPGIVAKMIDPYTGKLASESCPNAVRELFIAGTEPLQQCTDADHYLPIETFLGPEPRIQQAQLYGYGNTDYTYGNISYDSSNYAFTNYGSDDSQDSDDSGMIDYSDSSFQDSDQESNGSAEEQKNADQSSSEDSIEQPAPVVNDYESSSADQQPENEVAPQNFGEQSVAPTYLAPGPKKKTGKIFTNKDIPQSQPTEPENPDDDQN
jgi:penicillin-binding protein 1B